MILRARLISKEKAWSGTVSEPYSGQLTIMTPRRVAAGITILSTPTPYLTIAFNSEEASISGAEMAGKNEWTMISAPGAAATRLSSSHVSGVTASARTDRRAMSSSDRRTSKSVRRILGRLASAIDCLRRAFGRRSYAGPGASQRELYRYMV